MNFDFIVNPVNRIFGLNNYDYKHKNKDDKKKKCIKNINTALGQYFDKKI